MVPGNPDAGLICRFGPAYANNQEVVSYGILYRSQPLNSQQARELAAAISQASAVAPSGIASCPGADASGSIIVFHYPTGADVDLWFSDSGCRGLDNGTIGVWEIDNPAFYNHFNPLLDRLAPPTP
jgi:hypothetical protein